ncbi:MAG: hypothetical protein HY606_06600 [Planctomycetes bacterium]|nr:hypothetical protein [Planctomycetota bacterium]
MPASLDEVISLVKRMNRKVAVSLNPDTPLNRLK